MNLNKFLSESGFTTRDFYGASGAIGDGCVDSSDEYPCFYDSSFWTILKVSGDDRQSYLNGQTSNDLLKISLGNGQASSLNTPKGKTLSLLEIFRSADFYYLMYPKAAHEKVMEQLDLYLFTEDVYLEVLEPSCTITFPYDFSMEKIKNLHDLDFHEGSQQVWEKDSILILRGNPFQIPSITVVSMQPMDLGFLKEGWKPLCSEFLEKERIRHLYPLPCLEYEFEKTMTPELDQKDIISYSKGCFVGQEVFARIRTYGKTNRTLAAICLNDHGNQDLSGLTIEVQGVSKGEVTSQIQYQGKVYALGFIPTAYKEITKEVLVGNQSGEIIG